MADKKATKPSARLSPAVRYYLVLYNLISLAGWSYCLGLIVEELLATKGDYTHVCAKVGTLLTYVQTGAVLEIIHSALGFVKSPVSTTAIQVASRLLLCWGIYEQFNVPAVREHWLFTTMSIAWSITESVRYTYYGLNLVDIQPYWLLWVRYSFFFVLYPIGAGSEAGLVYQSLPYAKELSLLLYYSLIGILTVYPPGLLLMYSYMIGQRQKYLRGTGKERKTSKAE